VICPRFMRPCRPPAEGEICPLRESALREIFDKTGGHCHFFGDSLRFDCRGWSERMNGHWEVDHVVQRGKGGVRSADNCLPTCTRCNRLRWHALVVGSENSSCSASSP